MGKPWWTSKTIWAQVVSIIATILTAAGITAIDGETQALIVAAATAVAAVVLRVMTTEPVNNGGG